MSHKKRKLQLHCEKKLIKHHFKVTGFTKCLSFKSKSYDYVNVNKLTQLLPTYIFFVEIIYFSSLDKIESLGFRNPTYSVVQTLFIWVLEN